MPGQLEKGKKLGQYEIIEPLGKGGMASVYKAYQTNLDREVAIKVMAEQFASDPAFVERFRREARSIARLRHPNILTVYDAGENDNVLYIVMELIEGQTLKEDLNGRPLSLDRTAEILNQVASALDYANKNGIIHRDVKPSNVLLDKTGRAVLSDFGIAKMAQANTQLTGTGVGVGTPDYMSPEQAMGEELDARSDEYSLGVMVYEMLTGRVPFTGDTPIAIVMGHVSKPLPSLRSLNPEISPAVEQVIIKVLSKKPADRYEGCAAFAKAFGEAVRNRSEMAATQVMESSNQYSGMPFGTAGINPEAERLYQQARTQEQQNNFYGAFDTFNLLNNRYANYRDVPTVLERYRQMGYARQQTPPTMPGIGWQQPQPTPAPMNYYATGGTTQGGYTPTPMMPVNQMPPKNNSNRNKLIGGIGLLVLVGIIVIGLVVSNITGSNNKPTPTAVAVATPTTAPAATSAAATTQAANLPTSTPKPTTAAATTAPVNPTTANTNNNNPTTTPGAPLNIQGLQVINDSYDKDGLTIAGYTIRQGLGDAVFIYGLMKNTTDTPVVFDGKANVLDDKGASLAKGVVVLAPHIVNAGTTAPFTVFVEKAKGAAKVQWDIRLTPEDQDTFTSKIYYADYNFKSEDYHIQNNTLGPTLTGKVTNNGSGTATNVQMYAVVFGPDKSVIQISTGFLKDKEVGPGTSTQFEVDLINFPKGVTTDQCTYDVWFEGLNKQ